MFSLLNSLDSSLKVFFTQLTDTLGFTGYLCTFVGVEILFVLLFAIKSAFSYERRLKRRLGILNNWLFENKQINEDNIVDFNKLIKKGPKRLVYYWQQYILYREGNPSAYMTEQNLIEKPLKTSSFQSNIRNLGVLTLAWSAVAAVFGLASQTTAGLSFANIAVGLVFSMLVAIIGAVTIIVLRGRRVVNLDDIYHLYHYFARFTDNACAELTRYIDFDLLFTPKEIEKGNAQLREYYETVARKAKEEFDKAANDSEEVVKYDFSSLGIDGALLLNRAMAESEKYLNKKRNTIAEISRIEAQKDALKRNYETVQMDLQRKIQATKENIAKLIEQQAATSSRVEVGLLRTQQEKEVAKQASLQKDYDKEESRYNQAKQELDAEVEKLSQIIDEGLGEATKGMESEYQSFFAKVVKAANSLADKKSKDEKLTLKDELNKNEEELVSVQTQIKRLKDENDTLRSMLENQKETLRNMLDDDGQQINVADEGHYDAQGNYIYSDGSYHDAQGLFHDVDGKIYNMNGELVSHEVDPEEEKRREEEQIKEEQMQLFGAYISDSENKFEANNESGDNIDTAKENEEPKVEPYNPFEEEAKVESYNPFEEEAKVEPYNPFEEETKEEANNTEREIEPKDDIVEEDMFPNVQMENTGDAVEGEEPVKGQKRGRGRPRKEATEAPKPTQGKRGRPRKVEKPVQNEAPARRPGRPKKVEEAKQPVARKKRGRPVKYVNKPQEVVETVKRKPGRPRKNEEVTVADMNNIINEISQKLTDSKKDANNKINQVLSENYKDAKETEKEKTLKQVDALKRQIDEARKNGMTDNEISQINQLLDELIKKLISLNS